MKAWVLAGAAAAALIASATAASAEDHAPRPATTYRAPRAADGHASLEGIWTNASLTRLERMKKFDHLTLSEAEAAQVEGRNSKLIQLGNKPTDPKARVVDLPADCSDGRGTNCNYNAAWTDPGTAVMRVAGKPRSGFITTTPDGRVPMRTDIKVSPFGRALPRGLRPSDNPESRSLGERCLLGFGGTSGPIMLPVLYNNTYQIVQAPGQVAILVEMDHDVRVVRMGGKHLPSNVRPWMGDSIGRWEGDTLVIDTTNFNPQETLRGAAEHLHVVERLTPVGPNRLHYGFWVEDPTVFKEPWGGEYEFSRTAGPIYEYACHEGNYGLTHILEGARAEDRTGVRTAPTNVDQVAKAEDGEEGEGP